MTKRIARTKIVKTIDDEFRVKAFDASGNRIKSADYFTPDRDDAEATAREMVNFKATDGRGEVDSPGDADARQPVAPLCSCGRAKDPLAKSCSICKGGE